MRILLVVTYLSTFRLVSSLVVTQKRRSEPCATTLHLLPKKLESFLLGTTDDNDIQEEEDPHKEIVRFPDLARGQEAAAQAQSSLMSYLRQWGKMLEEDDSLTTPVICGSASNDGMKLSFQKKARYLSYSEQKDLEKGIVPDRKGAKATDAWSPGGVELLPIITTTDQELQLVVKRCDVDGDTMIKKRSEQTIARRLTEAVRIWQKVRDELQSEKSKRGKTE